MLRAQLLFKKDGIFSRHLWFIWVVPMSYLQHVSTNLCRKCNHILGKLSLSRDYNNFRGRFLLLCSFGSHVLWAIPPSIGTGRHGSSNYEWNFRYASFYLTYPFSVIPHAGNWCYKNNLLYFSLNWILLTICNCIYLYIFSYSIETYGFYPLSHEGIPQAKSDTAFQLICASYAIATAVIGVVRCLWCICEILWVPVNIMEYFMTIRSFTLGACEFIG